VFCLRPKDAVHSTATGVPECNLRFATKSPNCPLYLYFHAGHNNAACKWPAFGEKRISYMYGFTSLGEKKNGASSGITCCYDNDKGCRRVFLHCSTDNSIKKGLILRFHGFLGEYLGHAGWYIHSYISFHQLFVVQIKDRKCVDTSLEASSRWSPSLALEG